VNQDVYWAPGGLFDFVVAEKNPDLPLLFRVHPGCRQLSLDFRVGESMEPLGQEDVSEIVPLTDLRGAAIENGRNFPGVRGNSPIYLVVQVAALEQYGSRERQEEISSDHSVLLADFIKG